MNREWTLSKRMKYRLALIFLFRRKGMAYEPYLPILGVLIDHDTEDSNAKKSGSNDSRIEPF